jgi:hypothetical protein
MLPENIPSIAFISDKLYNDKKKKWRDGANA